MDKEYLCKLASEYNTESFIYNDPVSFPHRYKEKKDVEISAFISQWFAYGRRENFLKILEELALDMPSPYLYIKNREFDKYHNNTKNLYRFYNYNDFYLLCQALYNIYFIEGYGEKDMQDVLRERISSCPTHIEEVLLTIISLFKEVKGIPNNLNSACKRLCMFLRWMVRKDNIVDFGIWDILSPKDLIIPVDTHVFHQALQLGLTKRKTADFKTAKEITLKLKDIFPLDPLLGDFALFGYGVNNK